jgi:hypothetical protein
MVNQWSFKIHRKFGGKTYRHTSARPTKAKANKEALFLRKNGYNVRVIYHPSMKSYQIYIADKKRGKK